MVNHNSFVSANALPSKLIVDTDMIQSVTNHDIRPLHVQINPTNKCPLNCSFCSCSERDKASEISPEALFHALYKFKKLGAKAVTITGGGDPLAYGAINDTLEFCRDLGLKTGLVTNGLLFDRISLSALSTVTWCRVSLSCENEGMVYVRLRRVVDTPIDWAFSYVVTCAEDAAGVIKALQYANDHRFTHVRVVDDILSGKGFVDAVQRKIKSRGLDDSKAVYQGRKHYAPGSRRCLVSLLKPNVSADGMLMPCCGVQYAQVEPSRDYTSVMSMGSIADIDSIYQNQNYFDGSICARCYYRSYNDNLNVMWDQRDILHKEFK